MAERVVKVRYEAIVSGAVANLKRLQAATSDYADRSAEKVRKNEAAFDRMSTGLTVGAAAVGAGLGIMTRAWVGFDKEMSGVAAVAGATTEQMARLEQAAIDLGASTIFSASEVATAQAELVRAGVGVEDMLSGGLQGALDLAAAGGLELADASVIAAQAMNLFNLEGKDVPRVADVLASAANKSAADVSDLGQAMQQAGTVASQTGLSLEETAAALAMFADQGIRGSDAGTSLKTMLQRLTPQSKEAQAVMDELGFSAYDAQGNFIGLEALAGELQDSFGGLDTQSRNAALGVAFGSDAIRGAAILMEGGAEAARDYEAAMHDSGAASRMAATMTDNLAGDLEELGGAFETLFIQGGSVGNDFLRGVTQGLTGLVDAAAGAPRWLQEAGIALGTLVTVGGLGAGGVLKLGTSLVSLGDDIASIAGKTTGTSKALSGLGGILAGPWGIGIAAATGVLALYALEHGKTKQRVDALSDSLDDQTGAITENSEEMAKKALQDKGAYDAAERLGVPLDLVTQAALGQSDAMSELNDRLSVYSQKDVEVRTRKGGLGATERDYRAITAAVFGVNVELDEARRLWEQNAAASADAGEGVRFIGEGYALLATNAFAYAAAQHEANGGIDRWLPAAEQAALLGEEAAEAHAEWAQEMAGFSGSFVSASDALSTVNTATQEWAQAQADATDTAEDSWEDFWDGQSVSVDEWLTELERMAQAQADWETNMVALAGRVSQPVIDELARLGPEGAPLVAELVDASDEELARLEAVMGEGARKGTAAYATAMADAGPIIRAAAYMWGQDIADEIAARLASGEATAAEIVEEYDLAATIRLLSDETGFNTGLDASLTLGNNSTATAHLDGEDSGWRRGLETSMALGNDSEATAHILGDPWGGPRAFMGQLYSALGEADASSATADILGNAGPGRGTLAGFLWDVGRSAATVSIYARLMTNVQSMVSAATAGVRASLGMWPGRADGGPIELASGGPVIGPGGPRDDLVRARNWASGQEYRLSNGEHILTDAEVRALGGHGEVYRMRRAMLDGSIRYDIGGQIGAPRLSREAARYTTPAPVYASAGAPDFSALSAAADKIMVAAASIPDRIEVPVRVGSREVARATREGEQSWGARSTWGHETTTLPGGGRL